MSNAPPSSTLPDSVWGLGVRFRAQGASFSEGKLCSDGDFCVNDESVQGAEIRSTSGKKGKGREEPEPYTFATHEIICDHHYKIDHH